MSWLEFSSSVINNLAWPVAVTLAVFLLRHNIAGWIDKILAKRKGELTGPGGLGLRWEDISEQSNDSVASAMEAVAQTAAASPGAVLGTTVIPTPTVTTTSPSPEADAKQNSAEQRRRGEIARLVDAAAHWGWLRAKSGQHELFPHPFVAWQDDGRPYIVGTGDTHRNSGDTIVVPGPDGRPASIYTHRRGADDLLPPEAAPAS